MYYFVLSVLDRRLEKLLVFRLSSVFCLLGSLLAFAGSAALLGQYKSTKVDHKGA
jgi:hypothetical protein